MTLLTVFLGYKDLIVTPIYLITITVLIFYFKKFVPDKSLRPIFVKGLSIKLFSSIILGIIYEFYYKGGDTQIYYTDGSKLFQAFLTKPVEWFKLIFFPMVKTAENFEFCSSLYFFGDSQAFFVVRFTGFLSVFSFDTYTTTALFFAIISFNGLWHLLIVLKDLYPQLGDKFSYSIFYLPSLCFWGSGILKDSLLVAAIGWAFYAVYNLIFIKKRQNKCFLLLIISSIILLNVKPFLLIALLPSLLIWYTFHRIRQINSEFGKTLYGPFLFVVLFSLGFLISNYISQNTIYDVSNVDIVTKNIKINKDYLLAITKTSNGSYYDIGDLDGSFNNALTLAPKAIFYTYFRPFIWESKNFNMLLAAIESSYFLVFIFIIFLRVGMFKTFKIIWNDSFLLFAITYSIFYGAIIGLSSANYGTLVRYKIPVLPFFLCSLIIIYSNKKIKGNKEPIS